MGAELGLVEAVNEGLVLGTLVSVIVGKGVGQRLGRADGRAVEGAAVMPEKVHCGGLTGMH